jgi:hypothetical protein
MALIVAVAAVFALAAQQAVFAAPAQAWLTEEECACGGPGGGGFGSGYDDVGDQGDYRWPEDESDAYEAEHREEIEQLDNDIDADDWVDREARQEYEHEVAVQELRRSEKEDDAWQAAVQATIDRWHGETAEERLTRQQAEADAEKAARRANTEHELEEGGCVPNPLKKGFFNCPWELVYDEAEKKAQDLLERRRAMAKWRQRQRERKGKKGPQP